MGGDSTGLGQPKLLHQGTAVPLLGGSAKRDPQRGQWQEENPLLQTRQANDQSQAHNQESHGNRDTSQKRRNNQSHCPQVQHCPGETGSAAGACLCRKTHVSSPRLDQTPYQLLLKARGKSSCLHEPCPGDFPRLDQSREALLSLDIAILGSSWTGSGAKTLGHPRARAAHGADRKSRGGLFIPGADLDHNWAAGAGSDPLVPTPSPSTAPASSFPTRGGKERGGSGSRQTVPKFHKPQRLLQLLND